MSLSWISFPAIPILSNSDLNYAKHINGLFPGFTFSFEFFLYNYVNIALYFLISMSFYYIKYFYFLQFSFWNSWFDSRGLICYLNNDWTLPNIESHNPFFLYFYYASLTNAYINWKRISPLSGTNWFPFQSAPDIELVVINVKSIIFKGAYFDIILASWQNYVNALFATAQISPLKGDHDE